MKLIHPNWGAPAHVHAFMTTRHGGVSEGDFGPQGLNPALHVGDEEIHVMRNRAIIRQQTPSEPIWLNQIHSTNVWTTQNPQAQADAVVLNQAGQVGVIMTADCLPVIFADDEGQVVGAAHAGWRGLVNGVLEQTLKVMSDYGASIERMHVWLGAAIGPLQFEVGAEVLDAFLTHTTGDVAACFNSTTQGKYLADIYALARFRLAACGVRHITGGTHCTVTEHNDFYSYRRDKTTGRMATLIWMDAV